MEDYSRLTHKEMRELLLKKDQQLLNVHEEISKLEEIVESDRNYKKLIQDMGKRWDALYQISQQLSSDTKEEDLWLYVAKGIKELGLETRLHKIISTSQMNEILGITEPKSDNDASVLYLLSDTRRPKKTLSSHELFLKISPDTATGKAIDTGESLVTVKKIPDLNLQVSGVKYYDNLKISRINQSSIGERYIHPIKGFDGSIEYFLVVDKGEGEFLVEELRLIRNFTVDLSKHLYTKARDKILKDYLHDLKGPRVIINGLGDRLSDKTITKKQRSERLEMYQNTIIESIGVLGNLLNDFSTSVISGEKLKSDEFHISDLLNQNFGYDKIGILAEELCPKVKVNYLMDVSDGDVPIYGNKTDLYRVVGNLIKNSLESIDEASSDNLETSCGKAGLELSYKILTDDSGKKYHEICVADTGKGTNKEEFYRVWESETPHSTKGTNANGLDVIKKISAREGWAVNIDDSHVGWIVTMTKYLK